MKNRQFIIVSLLSLITTSCQEELVYHPFESLENGMPRYLAKVEETSYNTNGLSHTESTTEIFAKPIYDDKGYLQSAFVNFIGQDANNNYRYEQNQIIIDSRSRKDKDQVLEYTLEDGLIIDCVVTSTTSEQPCYYQYSYNSDKCLNHINVKKGDYKCDITLNWHRENIMSIKVLYENGYYTIYSYEYSSNKYYHPVFPSFWISCFEFSGLYGVDEILSCQGFFGKSISKDLVSKEFYDGRLLRQFDYKLDKSGYIIEVSEATNRKYTLEWR